MFGIERRREFRVGMDLPVSIGLDEAERDGRLGARLVDLSAGGALVSLDGVPGWRLSDVLGRSSRLRLEIGLRRFGRCSLQARLECVTAGENACEVAVRFVAMPAADRRRLQQFLGRYLAGEADEECRRRRRRYARRVRNRRILIAALVTVTGVALTFLCINLAEALPGWLASGRDALHREARDVHLRAVEEELRLMRKEGRDPEEFYRKLPPEERERIRGLFTPEERRQIRGVLKEEQSDRSPEGRFPGQ